MGSSKLIAVWVVIGLLVAAGAVAVVYWPQPPIEEPARDPHAP